MKIQVFSDLHGSIPKVDKSADYIFCPGDIATTPIKASKIFSVIREQTKVPIFYVLGNHEYYGNVFPDVIEDYRTACKISNVDLLENEAVRISLDFVILGCTLWTDYDNGRGIANAIMGMNDFDEIRNAAGCSTCPDDFIKAHKKSREFLITELERNRRLGFKTLILTHHMPSFSLINWQYKGSPLNGAFAVDMDEIFTEYKPSVWFYGHTHKFKDINLADTRFVCNPYGYIFNGSHREQTWFKENYLVEV